MRSKKVESPLYGQVHPVETPELLKAALSDLEEELQKLPNESKQGYLQALRNCPEQLDRSTKLKFLRCDVFNAKVSQSMRTRLEIETISYVNHYLPIY